MTMTRGTNLMQQLYKLAHSAQDYTPAP